jgi:hypothetical protein
MGQVRVQPYPLDAAHTEEREAVGVLQASEFALDGGTAAVEAAPLIALARNA